MIKPILLSCLFILSHLITFSQIPCENGKINGIYPCNQTVLMGHLTPDELLANYHNGFYLNDIWGWTDPLTNDEYAIIGLTDGVAFVRVTDPVNPLMLGKLNETPTDGARVMHGQSSWRDIKVYKDHAFIVSDLNYEHGMQVFDLTKLRDLTTNQGATFEPDFLYTEIASAHNIVINEETGYAYIVGLNQNSNINKWCNGLHVVNIQDPKNPVFVTCYDQDGYTHDAQVVIYQGEDNDYVGKEICFAANEDTFTIFNVDDKENISMVSRTGYANSKYTHQGWLTEDHNYFLSNDELDEEAFGFNAKTYIWDIQDLDQPTLIGNYYNEAKAIDHNLYTKDGLAFESNYLSGLRVMDLAEVSHGKLREVAFFDSYPQADVIDYGGTWSNYPYFESGNILISDMNNGLFIVRLDLNEVITSHPIDSVYLNTDARYQVEVSDSEATFKWQIFNDTYFITVVDDAKHSGAGNAELTVKLNASDVNTIYRCIVKDSQGNTHYSFPSLKPGSAKKIILSNTIKELVIYPNPVTNQVVVPIDVPVDYRIITLSGQLVLSGKLEPKTSSIDVHFLKAGVYFLEVTPTRTTPYAMRFIKTD